MRGNARHLPNEMRCGMKSNITILSRSLFTAVLLILAVFADHCYAKTTPTLSVSTSGTPSIYGVAVTFTATISSGPTGTITFLDGTTSIGTGTISGTTATSTTSSLATGSHSIKASYAGNATYNSVTSSVITQVVSKATPTLSVSTSGTPSAFGASVTFTATISSGLTGTITFYDGGVSVGTGNISGTSATYGTSALAAGSHSITARWPGNSNYNAVTSSAIAQVVNRVTPTITWTSPSAITYGILLSSTQLNASASVAGSFDYAPAAGTLLPPGPQTLSVTFTPNDTTDYNSATASVTLTVLAKPPAGVITTYAGYPDGRVYLTCADSGPATSAELENVDGVAVDAAGNVFIADTQHSCIRKVDASTGVITTIAGTGIAGYSGDNGPAVNAMISWPEGMSVDRSGNIYFADTGNGVIRKISSSGIIMTVAGDGSGNWDYSGDGGPAIGAKFAGAVDVAVDSAGNLYIADSQNMVVRKVSAATGIITTIAGNGTAGYAGDGGPATSAKLNWPYGVAVDPVGNLYIADMDNNVIRRVDGSTGTITTVAGSGTQGYTGNDGPATSAELNNPVGVTIDAAGNLFISDTNNNVIRMVAAGSGTITTIAGIGTQGYSGDGGPATIAELNTPWYLRVDASGNVYIAEDGSNRVRLVGSNVTEPIRTIPTITWANPAPIPYGTVLSTAQLNATANVPGTFTYSPSLGTVVPAGLQSLTVLFTPDDMTNYSPAMGAVPLAIALVTPTVTWANPAPIVYGTALTATQLNATASVDGTFAYAPDQGAMLAPGSHALSLTFTPSDPNYTIVSTSVTLVVEGMPGPGIITTVVGNGFSGNSGDGGLALDAALGQPAVIALDAMGNIFIPDIAFNVVRRVSASTGIITTIAGTGTAGFSGDGGLATSAQLSYPYSVVVDASGNVYIADQANDRIRKVEASTGIITTIAGTGTTGLSGDGGPATSAEIAAPTGVAIDQAGNLYISDGDNSRIREVLASTGVITTIAGTNGGYFGDGGLATSARLSGPGRVAFDQSGNLYFSDIQNHVIRKVTISTGIISTVAGNGSYGYAGDGGLAVAAELQQADSVAVDSAGNLFIADSDSNVIREVSAGTGVITTVAGTGVIGYSGDGGPATNAKLNWCQGVALDSAGNLYIGDTDNARVRLVGTIHQGQVAVTVSPSTALLNAGQTRQFTATVVNASNTSVTWSISPAIGTISSSGLYTAPGTIGSQQNVVVTATSQADSTKSASAMVTLLPAIAVSVSPSSFTLNAGQQQTFTATVTNTSNTAVTWSIDPAGIGAVDASGNYTAPATITVPQTVTITATSQADTSKSASATISLTPPCVTNGYSYVRSIVIDDTKVPNTDQVNFPFLFSTVDPVFRTTSNGGHVTNSNGYDIIFTSDPAGLNVLPFEQESYNASTGAVIYWIDVPTVSHAANTAIYMWYGNSNIVTSQANAPGVWNSGYEAVYHFPNGTTLSASDSTANGDTGAITGVTAATGKIDGGARFGNPGYITLPNLPNYAAADFTITTWVNFSSLPAYNVIMGGKSQASGVLFISTQSNGQGLRMGRTAVVEDANADFTWSTNTWYYVGLTRRSGVFTFYVNGTALSTNNVYPPDETYDYPNTSNDIGGDGGSYPMYGSLDEFRILNTARSADWIASEYNNQSSPSTFYSLGLESTVAVSPGSVALYASGTQQFATNVPGNCSAAVSWSMSPAGLGTLTPDGLYTAPASINAEQTVTITAASTSSPTTAGSAFVTLLPVASPTLSLSASVQPPYVTGTSQQFAAVLKNENGTPVANTNVTFTVTGVNASSATVATDSAGIVVFTYTGANNGNDAIQATSQVAGTQVQSTQVTVSWLTPIAPISSSTLTGQFFFTNGSCSFNTPANATPAWVQTFPSINFNPVGVIIPGLPNNNWGGQRPFTDVTVDENGNYTGTIVAQGSGYQAGVDTSTYSMQDFQAVFRGAFTVKAPGNVAFNFFSDDGFIFGAGNGATRVSGATSNMPAVTPFSQYPALGAYNGPAAGVGNQIVINFPTAGTYPYEVDYSECDGGGLTFTMAQGASSATGIPPTGSLILTPNSVSAQPIGGQENFAVVATDASGVAVPNLNVSLVVSGANDQNVSKTTDNSGNATFSYRDVSGGTDFVQAVATIDGMVSYSNVVTVPWTAPPSAGTGSGACGTLNVTASAPNTIILPSTLSLSGSASDSSLPQGDTISYQWSELAGPAGVSITSPQQASTTAQFTSAGSYVFQLQAGDADCSTNASAQITVAVNPQPGISQGWIGSPAYGSQVSGVVPIKVASGETLTSGILTFYPADDPTKVTILNSNTTGSGPSQIIGTFDTTNLANGQYWITLQAMDSTGSSSYNLALVTVVGNNKPGRVMSTVTDLVVPAKGLAIKIQRTYDSLNASKSEDFGYGWSLGTSVDLTVNPNGSVTFTLGGQRRTFSLTPQILGWFLPYYAPVYTPEPGMHGTLVSAGSGCTDFFDYLVPDGSLWACVGGGFFTPPGYVYTDQSGTAYTMTASGQLQSIVDKNGNALTITPNGITSSTGLSVPFVRDSSGRITKITDPQGNDYLYAYDTQGNLESVTYPNTPQASTYTYDSNHFYLSGTDFRTPSDPLPTTTYYGATDSDAHGNPLGGRLESVTDGLGEKTSYAYDLTTNTTTITYPPDGGGNVGTATMVYDTMGDLLTSTDPLGHTTTNTYDANQNLLSTTDPLNHTTCYTYDSNGNRTSVSLPQTGSSCSNVKSTTAYNQYSEPTQTIDELGNLRTFNYDVNFNPLSVTDSSGTLASFIFNNDGTMQAGAIGFDISANPSEASQFIYDADGNMASRTDALGRTTSYTYDSLGHKLTMVEPLPSGTSASAATTAYTYDAFGNLTQTAAPLGRTTSSTYDGNGNKLADVDARTNTTSYGYDALNRLITTTYPTSPTTTSSKTYDFRGNVVTETDQAGHVTKHVYDLAGRQTSVTQAYGTSNATTTTYAYDDAGRKTSETDALSHTTTYAYDAAGNLTGVSGVNGAFNYAYDNARNRISMTDGNNNTTHYQYDARKRLIETDYPDSTTKTNTYDGPGNLISVTDQNGNVVEYAYDAANQLQSVTQTNSPNAPNNVTSYGYNVLGDVTGLTDANSHLTENAFDLLSQPISKTLPDGSHTETRQYDTGGNLTSLTHFNGKTTTYTYDALNRLLSRTPDTTTGEPTVSFTYTATGKWASMADASGTTNYNYDSMDRLITKATPEGTLNYTYDAAGYLASMNSSHTNGVSMSYTYDSLNRLSTVVDARLAGNQTTTYAYDTASNVASVTYPNGVQYGFNYDELNRLKQIATSQTGYLYTFDSVGNRKTSTELNGRAVNWSFDGIYRLTGETITGVPGNENGTASYVPDPVGNRASATSSIQGLTPTGGTFNADDELAGESYDSDGNVTATGAKTFAYDTENHLMSMNGGSVTFIYDGDGNRVAKTVNGVTTRYLVDDLNPTGYAQVVEELSGGGAVQREYIYGLQRISQNQVVSNTWTPSFYGYDGFGTVRQLTSSAGAITDSYDYDAFGNKINSTGTTPNNYMYRGEAYDSDLGLYYLRARYMNPLTGRFVSRDPENGVVTDPKTLHKYNYAGGDPVNSSDPTGRDATTAGGGLSIPSSGTSSDYGPLRPVSAVEYGLVVGSFPGFHCRLRSTNRRC